MTRVTSVLLIARREVIAHVRSRSFVLGLLLTPLLLLAGVLLPSQAGGVAPIPIAIVDESGAHALDVIDGLQRHTARGGREVAPALGLVHSAPANLERVRADADAAAGRGQCEAVLLLPPDFGETGRASLRHPEGRQLSQGFRDAVRTAADHALRTHRLEAITPLERARLEAVADITAEGSSVRETSASGLPAALRSLGIVMLLYLTVLAMSHALLSSVIEEKSSRVVELLLATVTPTELMAGKILGIGAVGFLLVCAWSILGTVAASWSGRLELIDPGLFATFALLFTLGFLLYAAILAGLGALVRSIKEAQALVTPITILMMVPVLFWWRISQEPDGTIAIVMTWFPLTAPVALMTRATSPSPPGTLELAVACVWQLLWIVFSIRLAARLFRIGLLLQSTPPRLSQIARWLVARS